MTGCPPAVSEQVKYYVSLYLDPDTGKVFYVGKGWGNRAFSHLDDDTESDKWQRIKEIRDRGKEPRIEILIHGHDDSHTALRIECAVIDLLGVLNLTNRVRGWHSGVLGRMGVAEIISQYEHREAEISDPVLLIRINELYRDGMAAVELYDATRGIWRVGPRRNDVKCALAVYEGMVKEVYEVKAWFPACSTFTSRDSTDWDYNGRWESVATVVGPEVRDRYINRSVRGYFPKNAQNPIRYVNA